MVRARRADGGEGGGTGGGGWEMGEGVWGGGGGGGVAGRGGGCPSNRSIVGRRSTRHHDVERNCKRRM